MNNRFDELTKSMAQSVTRRAALKKFGVGLAGMALACFGLGTVAQGADPTFTTIDYPGAVATLAVGINAHGQIVGRYVDTSGNYRGYLLSDGNFTRIDVPGASATRPLGINLNDDIGPLNAGTHNTLFTALEPYVGGVFPVPVVNDEGDMVGWAYFKLLSTEGASDKVIRGYFVSPVNAEQLIVTPTGGTASLETGVYTIKLTD